MTSVVAICNQAIGRVRGESISELTDNTVSADACSTFYEPSRDFVLADFPWNFAGKSAALAQLSSTPEEWEYEYTYPADCLKIRYLHAESKLRHETDPIEYEVGIAADDTRVIMTNLDLARCRYTKKIDNPNHFDPHFVTMLSWYLASEIAIPIAGTAKGRVLADRAAQGYINARSSAYAANANEDEPGPPRDPETIRAHQ